MFISFREVTKAYFDCRKHKRFKEGPIDYEINYEENNYNLWQDLNNGTYEISPSYVFCVTKPKIREVFAAQFRDRIVHHIIINKFLPIFESEFSPHSFSCRKGKGVLYGVKSIENQIKLIGKDCWFLKIDLSGFFMSINKDILFNGIEKLLKSKCSDDTNLDKWINLIKHIIYNPCEKNCEKRGWLWLWNLLPPEKSLFNTDGKGIPIGNLTSQIFANFYLTSLDKILSSKVQGYGRYVDDIILLDKDKYKLLKLLPEIRRLLKDLGLRLNEKKTILQRCDKGVAFTGYIIKPWGIYNGKALQKSIRIIKFTEDPLLYFRRVNSYLGFMKRTLSYGVRRKIIEITKQKFPWLFKFSYKGCWNIKIKY